MSDKERVDTALVSRGLFPSREKAQAAIMAGQVYLKEKKILKPSESVTPEDELTVRRPAVEYVSRGALKLEKAVRVFQADFRDRVVMDIGASTGGFTDVSLRSGAKHVYSIDVGYGQLDWSLRNDPRVTVMERVNARYLKPEDFPERPEITVMDVSFISIYLILPPAAEIMGPEGVFYTLVKPQFEAGREKIGRKGRRPGSGDARGGAGEDRRLRGNHGMAGDGAGLFSHHRPGGEYRVSGGNPSDTGRDRAACREGRYPCPRGGGAPGDAPDMIR